LPHAKHEPSSHPRLGFGAARAGFGAEGFGFGAGASSELGALAGALDPPQAPTSTAQARVDRFTRNPYLGAATI
jgi:hypothetical protein